MYMAASDEKQVLYPYFSMTYDHPSAATRFFSLLDFLMIFGHLAASDPFGVGSK
jgi:hypothetical protein